MDYEALDNIIADVNNDSCNVGNTLSDLCANFGDYMQIDDNFHCAFKKIKEAYNALQEASRLLSNIE